MAIATFDLQSVLQIPSTQMSQLYYSHKLNLFNLTVYSIKKPNNAVCYCRTEVDGKRGSTEIGTCILTTKIAQGASRNCNWGQPVQRLLLRTEPLSLHCSCALLFTDSTDRGQAEASGRRFLAPMGLSQLHRSNRRETCAHLQIVDLHISITKISTELHTWH